jgi:uncharacterized protein YbaP (TraB family)
LWKVTGAEGGELYILGSIHVGTPDLYPLNPVIYEAFERSRRLVVEVKGESLGESPAVIRTVLDNGFYPDGETLLMHLDERQRGLLAPFLDELPMGERSNMRPWLAAVTLDLVVLSKIGYSGSLGVDRHFEGLARDRRMPVSALETVGEQLGLFVGLSEEDSKLLLETTLMELGEVEAFMGEVIAAWKAGDEGEFSRAFFEAYEKWPSLVPILEAVIFKRNETMYRRLLPYLKEPGPSFVVIGSGHLVTDRGIPALFRADGHRVEKF